MSHEEQPHEEEEEVPKGQFFFDNLLWLFLLSLFISLAMYNAWGLYEILRTPTP